MTKTNYNWIVSDKEEKSRVRSQGWHEHNHTWYNIQNAWKKIIVTISKQPKIQNMLQCLYNSFVGVQI